VGEAVKLTDFAGTADSRPTHGGEAAENRWAGIIAIT
jgi:hypothetical protein